MNFYEANPELAREIPVHATECVAKESEIEEQRQSERLDAARVLISKRKHAESLAKLYAQLEEQSTAPRTLSELCVHASRSLRNRNRR
jgi:hypothetical protein